MPESTLAQLLAQRVASLGPDPLLTYYSETGDRAELSAVTCANLAAKTAGFLTNELDVTPGEAVALRVPRHWSVIPWLHACALIGVTADLAPPTAPHDARVVVHAEPRDSRDAADHVLISTHPLGMPEPGGAPPGWFDHAREALGQPDMFTPVAPQEFGIRTPAGHLNQQQLLHLGGDIRSRMAAAVDTPQPSLRFAAMGEPWQSPIHVAVLAVPMLHPDSCLWWVAPESAVASDERVDVSVAPHSQDPDQVNIQPQDRPGG